MIVRFLRNQGVLEVLSERVRGCRGGAWGETSVIDFLAVLAGLCHQWGTHAWRAFYEALLPWAEPFMALCGRDRLPARSTLSRFLASLSLEATEALPTLFLKDLLSRPLSKERQTGTLVDRAGRERVLFDIDGTPEAASPRALPKKEGLPEPQRRLDELCAAGYTGRKRGEVVRTRTTISQAHSYQWLG